MKLKIRILFVLGVLVALIPFTGFPETWKTFLVITLGILICIMTYIVHVQLRAFRGANSKSDHVTESYSENRFNPALKDQGNKQGDKNAS